MSDNSVEYQALGEAVLEEVLVLAGIAQGRAPGMDPVPVSLNFRITSDAQRHSVVILCERIGTPFKIELNLPDGA